eukprot:Rhum_TRINITY_DN14009_c0_g1::Rhum_TRINITY_DN14009_c0_g1_i2::g.67387::m.67387
MLPTSSRVVCVSRRRQTRGKRSRHSRRRRASRRKGGSSGVPALPCQNFQALARKLDEAVGARAVRQLEADDLSEAKQLGRELIASAFGSGLRDSLRVDEVPGVMWRCPLYEGENLVVRLHLFRDVAETSIHNHQNNFASVCLYGSYTHTIWTVTSETDKTHYECRRGSDGHLSESQKKPGGLVLGNSYESSGYFLGKETHHTVKAGDGTPQSGTLTLYVKGRESEGTEFATRILSQDGKYDEGLRASDIPLHGKKKRAILQRMSDKLWSAAERAGKN